MSRLLWLVEVAMHRPELALIPMGLLGLVLVTGGTSRRKRAPHPCDYETCVDIRAAERARQRLGRMRHVRR